MSTEQLRLNSIKLAGFKSFVDPTTVNFDKQLTAVVGPNGCGKSNIIDAVRWVMGESSAKQLRGDSMSDVIFNGSTDRQPVGQASVELVFNNPNGALGGEYANYREISIRRSVTRDGQSNYYLNGTRCRRRDIIGIFLGTGLGNRSYAIIEQGMISRLIEAKPDDLRIHLEEAAGISKYKQRRKETETRIQHTQDNLNRLNDLREEIEKVLSRLQRQAGAANRFQELKKEETQVRSQLLSLRYQRLTQELDQLNRLISERELTLESHITQAQEIETQLEVLRDKHTECADIYQEAQERYYTIGGEVSRIEQSLQHQRERKNQLQRDLQETQTQLAGLKSHLSEDTQRIEALVEQIEELTPEELETRNSAEATTDELKEVEHLMQLWQEEWDAFHVDSSRDSQQAEVQQTRIRHIEQSCQEGKNRLERMAQDITRLDTAELENELNTYLEQQQVLVEKQQRADTLLQEQKETLEEFRQRVTSLSSQLDKQRSELQTAKGRQGSLETLQQAALGKDNHRLNDWLKKQGLEHSPRLVQNLKVEKGWEKALETVLSENLQAICVEDLEKAKALQDLTQGTLSLISKEKSTNTQSTSGDKLLNKITSDYALDGFLEGIYVDEDPANALHRAKSLKPHESIITPTGLWIGQNWARISCEKDAQAGVIQREAELKALEEQKSELTLQVASIEENLENTRVQLKELEQERDFQQQHCNQINRELADLNAQLRVKQSRVEQMNSRKEQLSSEREELMMQSEKAQEELSQARALWQEALSNMETHALRRQTLTEQRDEVRERLDIVRNTARQARENSQRLHGQLQALKAERDAKLQGLNRIEDQLQTMEQRCELLSENLLETAEPITELEENLKISLEQRMEAESVLQEAKKRVDSVEFDSREKNQERHQVEDQITQSRNRLEQARLDTQTTLIRKNTLEEQLKEFEIDTESVLKAMEEPLEERYLEEELQSLTGKIQRLGPINLAAIEEYKVESERKEYLDKQHADLSEALQTLDNAIRKIDKETRHRFRETFDKVNQKLMYLFPKIFNGGEAYLELTGEDLLDTGVTIMARPPGKKNSTIHLLSGGEKALTALALVFAIFQLRPAPFCMLDEVDAPLDDSNVLRYCNLVKDMSKELQFIFISHNKLAIEMADQLMGVTMREPGVSRLVSVDIDQALAMADA